MNNINCAVMIKGNVVIQHFEYTSATHGKRKIFARPEGGRVEVSTPVFFFLVEVLCDITRVLEFVGDYISAADVKHIVYVAELCLAL